MPDLEAETEFKVVSFRLLRQRLATLKRLKPEHQVIVEHRIKFHRRQNLLELVVSWEYIINPT